MNGGWLLRKGIKNRACSFNRVVKSPLCRKFRRKRSDRRRIWCLSCERILELQLKSRSSRIMFQRGLSIFFSCWYFWLIEFGKASAIFRDDGLFNWLRDAPFSGFEPLIFGSVCSRRPPSLIAVFVVDHFYQLATSHVCTRFLLRREWPFPGKEESCHLKHNSFLNYKIFNF